MLLGLLAGLFTCAVWGLTFVAARLVHPFTLWDITIARYAIFGLTCLISLVHPYFRPRNIGWRHALAGSVLGLIGYVAYFALASQAVLWAGSVVPPLIIGITPIMLPVLANLIDKSISWRRLGLPLLMIGSGILIVNAEHLQGLDVGERQMMAAGIGCAVAALLVWVVYGIFNAKVMRSENPPRAIDWTTLHGIGCLIGAGMLIPLASNAYVTAPAEAVTRFFLWAIVLGIAASWLATWCWSIASSHLPLALTAQLIIAETVFGLIFGLMMDGRWPTITESLGALLQILGVSLAVHQFTRRKPKAVEDEVMAVH
ncbi:DMT family transporter [Rhizobium rhizoryzae]|uniref:DMT family transporter n=1 Tax=Rhizobium rhizoryzae TaxID=451876 RepID=UPI00289835C6|nr:DMT family transporter [Rhizobium rhizoryzae]